MPDTPSALSDRLFHECQRTLEFFQSIEPSYWDKVVYHTGSAWTLYEVLAHFVSAEREHIRLIDHVLNGGSGAPVGFNIDEFNEQEAMKSRDFPSNDLLTQFVNLRRSLIEKVAAMEQDDLDKTGRDPFLGIASLAEIIKLIYRHNQIHQREIRRILFLGEAQV